MNITSEDEALLELFENGKTSDKKYKSEVRVNICLPSTLYSCPA